ncbi:MAG: hypothetical protein ACFE68_05565 [Candidatus Hodarchaeota archaeon]
MISSVLSLFSPSVPDQTTNITDYPLFLLFTIILIFWIVSLIVERILRLFSKTLYDVLFLPGTFLRFKIKSFFALIFGMEVIEKSVLEDRFHHEETRAGPLVWVNVVFPLLIEGYLGIILCFSSVAVYGESLQSFLFGVIIFGLGLSFIGKASPSRKELEEIKNADDESKKIFTIIVFLAIVAYVLASSYLSQLFSLLVFCSIVFFPKDRVFGRDKGIMSFRGINLLDEIQDFELME